MMDATGFEMIMDVPTFQSFMDDLGDFFATQLTWRGYSFPHDADPWMKAALFWAMTLRTIQPHPRVVHWSTELRAKSSILSPDILLALYTIEAESLAGVDLNPRMSRRQKDAECHDDLFNDWGILHLHLGPRHPNPGELAKGRNDLLFVVVRQDAIHFVDQLTHHVFSHADPALLEIVHKNWPHLIASYRFDDVFVPPDMRLSPEMHAKWRKAGITFATTMSDGTTYMQPGGGAVMSEVKRGKRGKLNGRAVSWANDIFNKAAAAHKWCRENTSKLVEQIRHQTGIAPTSLRELRLCLDQNGLFLLDNTTRFKIRCDRLYNLQSP